MNCERCGGESKRVELHGYCSTECEKAAAMGALPLTAEHPDVVEAKTQARLRQERQHEIRGSWRRNG